MKRLLICLAILALSTSTSTGNSADKINQWSACGPWSDHISALAIDPITPSTLYAGTHRSGVYKSTDAGSNWTRTGFIVVEPLVRVLVIDPLTPSTLYAGTSNDGVFKSTDGGDSWTAMNNGLPTYTTNMSTYTESIYPLVIDPLTPSTLYAGTDAAGVYKSMDGGDSWTAMNNGLPTYTTDGITYTESIYTLAIDPLTPSTLYAGTSSGVYTFVGDTTNGGGGSGDGGSGNHSGSSGSGCFISTASP
jgi:hypothetical protein